MEWNLVDGHLTISGEITHTNTYYSNWPWYSQRNNIQSVSFSNAYFTSGSNACGMFYYCSALISLDFSGFNTSNVTDMSYMFYNCNSLTSLDLSNFNTSNVTDMKYMFYNCKVTSLDLSNFNTSSVTNMQSMFDSCKSLISLDLSNFDTSKVTNMNFMFEHCELLISLDLSSFNTSKVTGMYSMFSNCSNLRYIRISNSWTVEGVTSFDFMFYKCTHLLNYNSSYTDKDKAYAGFGGYLSDDVCAYYDSSDNTLNFIGRYKGQYYNDQTINGKTYYVGFEDATSATRPSWTTQPFTKVNFNVVVKPKFTYQWFYMCTSLTTFNNLQLLDTSNVTNMSYMFYYCNALTSLDLSNFDTSSATNMNVMFCHCTTLTSLDLSNFDTSGVTDMVGMFGQCKALTSLGLSNFDTSSVTDMHSMFSYCTALTSLDLFNFNTSSVTDMNSMFEHCIALTSILWSTDRYEKTKDSTIDNTKNYYILNLSTNKYEKVENPINENIENYYNFTGFNTSNVTNMSEMFIDCSNLTLLDLSFFNTSKVTMMDYMFYNCTATIPVLYVCQTECTTTAFTNNSQGIIYLVRDSEVIENTTVRDFWRSVANSYNNVHFEYDDANRPIITPEISRGKLVSNQWQADELGNIIKIKLNPQVYNNNVSSVLSTNNIKSSGGLSIEVIDCNNYTVSQDSSISDLFYVTLNTDPDKQYNANVILTDLSDISVTRSIILPGVFAMIEFRAGGHGMSIGKICEQDGLEVDIPTAIGEKLVLPTNNNTIDLTKNQLVIGRFNKQKNNALFVIGNGNENYRHNILEVYGNEIHLTNRDKESYTYNFTELSDILLDDTITEVNNLDSNNFYLDNINGLTSGAASYNVSSGKSQASLKISLSEQTEISFSTYVSSESGCDYGAIYIGPQSYSPTRTQIKNGTIDANGGQYVYRKSGNQPLEEVSITLEPGEYYVSFIYAKDSSDNSNDDRFYIKSMTFKNVEVATTFTIDNNNISLNSAGDLITPTMAGQIIMFGGATSKIPLGWLPCDGSSVLIADYPLLAAALYDGSVYVWGQVDSTHFNLPDLRGRAPIGVNGDAAATGLTARTVGTKNIGEETHTLKAAEAAQKAVSTNGMSANASHNHEMGYKVADRGGGSTGTRMGPYGHTTSGVTVINTASTSVAHTHSITGSDATTGHNNMQPSAVVNFIICTGQMPQ